MNTDSLTYGHFTFKSGCTSDTKRIHNAALIVSAFTFECRRVYSFINI